MRRAGFVMALLITAAVQVEGEGDLFVCDDDGQPLLDLVGDDGQPFPGAAPTRTCSARAGSRR